MTYPKIDKPTVPGWYWARFHGDRHVPVEVRPYQATDHTTGGRVYERTDYGTVRLVAQMARRKGQKKRVEKGKRS